MLPNGEVLVAAGSGFDRQTVASAELYDPRSGSWTTTGSLVTARDFHTATLLPNGKVLIAAGEASYYHVLASAELYDSASGSWSNTGSLAPGR